MDLKPPVSQFRPGPTDPAGRAVQQRRRELQGDHDDAVRWLSGRGRFGALIQRLTGGR